MHDYLSARASDWSCCRVAHHGGSSHAVLGRVSPLAPSERELAGFSRQCLGSLDSDAFALVELVIDQLPTTPSRTVPVAFGARMVTGALSGAAIGARNRAVVGGAVAGVAGAVVGTLGGHALRTRLAAAFGNDRPAAFLEDALAIGGALLIGSALR